jgi:hypothetical protein
MFKIFSDFVSHAKEHHKECYQKIQLISEEFLHLTLIKVFAYQATSFLLVREEGGERVARDSGKVVDHRGERGRKRTSNAINTSDRIQNLFSK